jgi:hypothetical protein
MQRSQPVLTHTARQASGSRGNAVP